MSYLVGVVGPLLFQLGFSYAIIVAGTGNGSFVGLGAMLMALIGVPFTALLNFLAVRAHRSNPEQPCFARLVLTSLVLPVAQLALWVAVSVFRL